MPTETAITKRIVTKLKARGIFSLKLHGSVYGRRGMPDLLVIVCGRAIFLEVKVPGVAPTRLQEHRIAECRAAGAVAEVVTSWEDVEHVLEGEQS